MKLRPLLGVEGMRKRVRRRKNGPAALRQMRDDERHVYATTTRVGVSTTAGEGQPLRLRPARSGSGCQEQRSPSRYTIT